MIERGYTWSQEWRHICEVRFIIDMPTRDRRTAYLEGIARRRGQAAANALRRDVRAAWDSRRETPPPPGDGPRVPSVGAVHLGVNAAGQGIPPGLGSFLVPPHEGDSDPVKCVDSGVAA